MQIYVLSTSVHSVASTKCPTPTSNAYAVATPHCKTLSGASSCPAHLPHASPNVAGLLRRFHGGLHRSEARGQIKATVCNNQQQVRMGHSTAHLTRAGSSTGSGTPPCTSDCPGPPSPQIGPSDRGFHCAKWRQGGSRSPFGTHRSIAGSPFGWRVRSGRQGSRRSPRQRSRRPTDRPPRRLCRCIRGSTCSRRPAANTTS